MTPDNAPPAGDTPRRPSPRAIAALATSLFLIHAARYLYFFVDDEAIPFVYARNLLRGRGLVYTSLEGRVEGYSDSLALVADTMLLALARLTGAPMLSVLAAAKLISLAAGAVLVWTIARRLAERYQPAAAMAGIAFVVLAGPLAVWSCSALEAASVALLVAMLALALQEQHTPRACIAAVLLVLLRIDGFVYVGAAVLAALGSDPRERFVLARRVAVVSLVALLLLTCARFWYFGALLPAPIETKILYKLVPHARLLIKRPVLSYVQQFASLYGWGFLILAFAGAALPRPVARSSAVLLNALILIVYVSVVGDWMFGLRFFVPILPLMAFVVAEAAERVLRRSRRLGLGVSALVVAWLVVVAVNFSTEYAQVEKRDNFLTTPSLDPARFFAPYWSVYSKLRDKVQPGTVIADNQAGFVPFMLDAENLDDLGICSSIVARLPTRDVAFTEVGRFVPFTNKDAITAGQAYLLARHPAFIIEREDLLRAANDELIPSEILAGAYQLAFRDTVRNEVAFVPTARDVSAYRRESRLYLENVAHVSHLAKVSENGVVVPVEKYRPGIGFLHGGRHEVIVNGTYYLELRFDTGLVPVYELHIESMRSTDSVTVALTLSNEAGEPLHEERLVLAARTVGGLHVALESPVAASRAILEIDGPAGRSTRVMIEDLRVQAQPLPLQQYVATQILPALRPPDVAPQ